MPNLNYYQNLYQRTPQLQAQYPTADQYFAAMAPNDTALQADMQQSQIQAAAQPGGPTLQTTPQPQVLNPAPIPVYDDGLDRNPNDEFTGPNPSVTGTPPPTDSEGLTNPNPFPGNTNVKQVGLGGAPTLDASPNVDINQPGVTQTPADQAGQPTATVPPVPNVSSLGVGDLVENANIGPLLEAGSQLEPTNFEASAANQEGTSNTTGGSTTNKVGGTEATSTVDTNLNVNDLVDTTGATTNNVVTGGATTNNQATTNVNSTVGTGTEQIATTGATDTNRTTAGQVDTTTGVVDTLGFGDVLQGGVGDAAAADASRGGFLSGLVDNGAQAFSDQTEATINRSLSGPGMQGVGNAAKGRVAGSAVADLARNQVGQQLQAAQQLAGPTATQTLVGAGNPYLGQTGTQATAGTEAGTLSTTGLVDANRATTAGSTGGSTTAGTGTTAGTQSSEGTSASTSERDSNTKGTEDRSEKTLSFEDIINAFSELSQSEGSSNVVGVGSQPEGGGNIGLLRTILNLFS